MSPHVRDGNPHALNRHAGRKLSLRQCVWSLGLCVGLLLTACTMPQRNAAPSAQDAVAAPPVGLSAEPARAQAMPPASPIASAKPSPPVGSTLGTQWGEGRASQVQTVQAIRLTPDRKQAAATLRYSDEASIRRALGASADRQLNLLLNEGRVEWSVRDAQDRPLPIFGTPGGNADFHVAGRDGERYELVYVNRSQRHYEVIATVDGLDVLTGQPGSVRNRGYLLEPGETLRIDGFRKNDEEVATFRFSSKSNAYASNTPAGNPRNVGVIGTALFEVRLAGAPTRVPGRSVAPDGQNAFPADGDARGAGRFAPPPQYR